MTTGETPATIDEVRAAFKEKNPSKTPNTFAAIEDIINSVKDSGADTGLTATARTAIDGYVGGNEK